MYVRLHRYYRLDAAAVISSDMHTVSDPPGRVKRLRARARRQRSRHDTTESERLASNSSETAQRVPRGWRVSLRLYTNCIFTAPPSETAGLPVRGIGRSLFAVFPCNYSASSFLLPACNRATLGITLFSVRFYRNRRGNG